jgi:hypothetical protein
MFRIPAELLSSGVYLVRARGDYSDNHFCIRALDEEGTFFVDTKTVRVEVFCGQSMAPAGFEWRAVVVVFFAE